MELTRKIFDGKISIVPSFFINRLKFSFPLTDTSAVGRFIEWRAIL